MTYYVTVIESRTTQPRTYACDATTLGAARREAREYLGGVLDGEGSVRLYDADPRETDCDPVAVLS